MDKIIGTKLTDLFAILILSLLLIETILLLSWSKLYFRFGIPVYKKKIPFYGRLSDPFDPKYLEDNFEGDYVPTIYFRKLNETECAFREKLFNIRLFSYIPVMRGLIKGDVESNTLLIIGYLN